MFRINFTLKEHGYFRFKSVLRPIRIHITLLIETGMSNNKMRYKRFLQKESKDSSQNKKLQIFNSKKAFLINIPIKMKK
jgi:hypothetical protein